MIRSLARIMHEAERWVVVPAATSSLKPPTPALPQQCAAHQRGEPFVWGFGRGAVVFECYIKPRTGPHAIGSSAGRSASCVMRASPSNGQGL